MLHDGYIPLLAMHAVSLLEVCTHHHEMTNKFFQIDAFLAMTTNKWQPQLRLACC
jgi:hypothetical protein